MSIETAIATGLTPTSTGTASFEVSGFGTPQAAIVTISTAVSGTNPKADSGLCYGFTDGTTDAVTACYAEDNVGTMNTSRFSAATLVRVGAATETTVVEGVFSAWATNGLTINFTKANASQYFVSVCLIKGCTNAKVTSHQLTTTGVNDLTTIGFKPNLVYLTSIGNASVGDAAHFIFCLGAAHNNSSDVVTQGMVALSSVDNGAQDVCSGVTRNDSCVGQLHNNVQTWQGSIQDFDSSGFSINTGASSPGSDYIFCLSLDTGDTDGVDVSVVNSPTTTGTWNVSAPGFKPQSTMLFLSNSNAVNTIKTVNTLGVGVSAFSSTVEVCSALDHNDGATTSDVQSNYATKAAQIYGYSGGHVLIHEGTFSSFDSTGYNLSFPTYVSGTARPWLSVSIEELAAVDGNPWYYYAQH